MEFPRVRTTRTNKTKLRVTRKQTGGAPSYAAPLPKYFTGSYIAKWTTKLAKPELVRLLTDPTLSVAVGTTYSPEYYTAWMDAIKYQDRIYRAGLEIIIEDLTQKTGDQQYSDIITKITSNTLPQNTDVISLFTTLEHILSLTHGSKFTQGDPTNKFEYMFRTRLLSPNPKYPPLETEMANLLLNPKRIENILIQNVASIIVMLKEATNMQEILLSLANPILKAALIKKWMFFSVHGTELQTNEEIRDSFLTGFPPCTIVDILQFWIAFVEELEQQGPVTIPATGFKDEYPIYGILAAKLAKNSNLLDEITKVAVAPIAIDYASIPDGIGQSPVGGIFTKLIPNLVFFLKHLEGAIEEASHTSP
jgi:hypothetical protein